MLLSVVALVAAALCSGTAAVLQASAVGRSSADHVVGFLGGLARDPRYLGGLVLVAAGFLASLVAVQQLPLFLVQAGRAASLGVTAVLAAALLGSRLALREVVALGILAVGLVAVAVAAAPSQITAVPRPVHWAVLLAAVVLLLAVLVVGRTAGGHRAAAVLGVLAGSCFGVVSLAARIVEPTGVGAVLGDPVTWAVGVAGLAGLAGGALALQRGGVVVVTAAMVATESVLGAVLGLAIGDRTVPGLGWLAVLGFAVTVGGALLLARFGAPTLAGDPADLDRA